MDEMSRADDQASSLLERRHAATDRPTFVVIGERRFLAIDGLGDPRGAGFTLATSVLRRVARDLHDRLVRDRSIQTRVAILECAWWMHPEPAPDETPDAFEDRSAWHWQQMIEIPQAAADEDAAAAIRDSFASATDPRPAVRIVRLTEGQVAQILHVGGSASEARSLRKLYDAISDAGLRPQGHIHELRLVDEASVPAERARAILRVPIAS
jgi:hypothetical protein